MEAMRRDFWSRTVSAGTKRSSHLSVERQGYKTEGAEEMNTIKSTAYRPATA